MVSRLFTLFIFSLFFACNNPKKGKQLNSLRLCSLTDPVSFDPRVAGDTNSQAILHMLFEGLTRINPEKMPEPAVAGEIIISDDKLTYTFILKKTYWSNGDPVTAYDFEKSWKKTISLDFISKYSYPFYIIKNVKNYRENKYPISTVGIRAKNPMVFTVELEHPAPYFLELIANPVFSPVHPTLNKKTVDHSYSLDFIGNGPFKIKTCHFKSEILLDKNPYYWDSKNVNLKNISISIISEKQVAQLLYDKGEIDWLGHPFSGITPDALPSLKKQKKLKISAFSSVFLYVVNTDLVPFTNRKVRKAFSLAINREQIQNNFLEAGQKAAYSILLPEQTLQDNSNLNNSNLPLANKLFNEGLQELKLSKKDLPQITVTHFSTDKALPQIIQKQLESTFQIDVQIQNLDWHSCLSKLKKNHFQLMGLSWESWINDPIYSLKFYEVLKKNIDPEITDLIYLSDQELDLEKRKSLLQKAESLLIDNQYVIPIYYQTNIYLKKEHLKNVYFKRNGSPDFTYSFIDPEE